MKFVLDNRNVFLAMSSTSFLKLLVLKVLDYLSSAELM